MLGLVIVLIILIVLFGGGGYYVGRPGYAGPGAGLSNLLYIVLVIAVIVLVLRLVGIV